MSVQETKADDLWHHPIVEEARAARDAHARQFGYDIKAIMEDLRRQQAESGRTFVSFPARRIKDEAA